MAVYARGVNLGFNQGALLEDPDDELLGTGKRIRHLSLKSRRPDTAADSIISEALSQSRATMLASLERPFLWVKNRGQLCRQ